MPDAPLEWKIAYLKAIRDMSTAAACDEGRTPRQDLIWIQEMVRDGYISAEFRMGYRSESQDKVEWGVPNMIWNIHILEKGRQLIAMEAKENSKVDSKEETHEQRLIRILTLLAGPSGPIETDETWTREDLAALEELLSGEFATALQIIRVLQGQIGAICGIQITLKGREFLNSLQHKEPVSSQSEAAKIGGDEQSKNKASRDKETNQPKHNLPPSNINMTKVEWGGFFVDLYVTLWIWSDLIDCAELKKLCFLLLSVFVSHGVLCYFVSKILRSWRWALLVWLALTLAAAYTAHINYRSSQSSTPKTKPAPTSITIVQQPDYIAGTQFTESQLEGSFPFGYIIFRLDGTKWTYEPDPDGHVRQTEDLEKIVITPDFEKRQVTWNIPNVSFVVPEGMKRPVIRANTYTETFPISTGSIYTFVEFHILGEPQMFVATLSDNQLHPVFLLGFRIADESNQQH